MIPYEELCAALDRHNNVEREPAPRDDGLVQVETGEVVEEAAVMEEAEAGSYQPEPEPMAPAGELVVSSAGEDAAAAAGEIGGPAVDEADLPPVVEQAIVVEPAEALRHDSTDEVSLTDVQVLGGDERDQ